MDNGNDSDTDNGMDIDDDTMVNGNKNIVETRLIASLPFIYNILFFNYQNL